MAWLLPRASTAAQATAEKDIRAALVPEGLKRLKKACMPSLGQTLCQLEKTFLNQWLERKIGFFQGKKAAKEAKTPVFVACQRQDSRLA